MKKKILIAIFKAWLTTGSMVQVATIIKIDEGYWALFIVLMQLSMVFFLDHLFPDK